jgi:hypothetical protein
MIRQALLQNRGDGDDDNQRRISKSLMEFNFALHPSWDGLMSFLSTMIVIATLLLSLSVAILVSTDGETFTAENLKCDGFSVIEIEKRYWILTGCCCALSARYVLVYRILVMY